MSDATPPNDTALGTQSATLEVGQRVFRQYVLKRFLSRSALGSAWLVVHEGIGRELAMRFLPEAWLHEENVISRVREGVVRLLEVTHPGIVGILDFVRDPQAAAIVMRYVEAESALDRKAQQPQRCFEVETLRPWLAHLCEALDFAWRRHEAFHGDLCPANVLITPLGDLKLADFGLARCLYDVESPGGGPLLAMPPAYASPERLRGEPATVSDDVHGFGATVFELLTSKPPSPQGRTAGEIAPSMTDRRAALGLGGDLIPPEWEEVIAACLAESAVARPGSLREVGERLKVLAPLPPEAERAPLPTVLPRPQETVVGYRPPSTRPAAPAPVFPSSEVTAAMEPPTMHGVEPPSEPPPAADPLPPVEAPAPPAAAAAEPEPEQESAPATIDENFDFEQTVGEVSEPTAPASETPPPEPDDAMATAAAAEPPPPAAPFVPPPPSQPEPAPDDASATIAAETPPPPAAPAPVPPALPPEPQVDLERTVAEVRPAAPSAVTPPPMPPPIPVPAEMPRNLEDSVTLPTPQRHPVPPTESRRAVPAPAPVAVPPPAKRSPWGWILLGGVVLVLAVVAPLTLRDDDTPSPTPAPAEPTIAPIPPGTPIAAEPTPASMPIPATPAPAPAMTPAPPTQRTIQPAELATLSSVTDPLLLEGSFRVSTVTPAQAGHPASVTMRPADAALAGKIRIVATLTSATSLPGEGSTVELTAASRYYVRVVRTGADGQVNVTVEQR